MGLYVDLAQADKDRIQTLLALVRPEAARLYKDAINTGAMVSEWNAGVSALITGLDVGELIPNTTGLAGAQAITKENLANNLMAYITSRSGFATTGHRDNIVPAAGAHNVQV